jgi:hypothetical protein
MSRTLHWQKSTFSDGGEGNTCVELAGIAEQIRLRESETPGVQLATSAEPLAGLIRAVKAGGLSV